MENMKSIRVIGLCLVAAFAFSAIAVAGASAETTPTFVKCVKAAKVGGKYTGQYTNKTCTVKASEAQIKEGKQNKYEAAELKDFGQGVHFSAKSKATTIKARGVSGNPQAVTCSKDKYVGELFDHIGSGKVEASFTFEGCKGNGTEACGNTGSETIHYTPGFTEVIWTEAGEKRPGLLMLGGPTFKCGAEEVSIEGIAIGTLTTSSKGLKVVFNVTLGGAQEDETLWSEGEEIGGLHWSSSPSEVEATLKGSEEIKAKGVIIGKG
jgi:hypothetical protein